MRDKPLVVVVEDDVEMNQLQRELLELNGMDTVAAYDGAEALRLAAAGGVDAVLLDLMLPEMDGFETCRRLRQRQGASLPVVVVTALDREDCRRVGREVAADAYFRKPFDPDAVVAALRRLIRDRNGHEG